MKREIFSDWEGAQNKGAKVLAETLRVRTRRLFDQEYLVGERRCDEGRRPIIRVSYLDI